MIQNTTALRPPPPAVRKVAVGPRPSAVRRPEFAPAYGAHHAEIFPGTFASTTETTDFVLQGLGLRRTPVLRWGPRGMQQLSEVQAGRLRVLGLPETPLPITSTISTRCRSFSGWSRTYERK